MSVSAIAALRPANGRCLRHATAGLLSVQVTSRAASLQMRAVVRLRPLQRRHESSTSPRRPEEPPRSEPPKITFRQFVGRALGAGLRNLALTVSPRGVRSAYRDAPIMTSAVVAALLFLFVTSSLALRTYFKTFYNAEFSRYPEPVANTLRRAIYYTNYRPDAELALKHYKKAMEQCAEIGLDPFSEEVLGIRIQIAAWLQGVNNFKPATDVLELVLADCRKWIGVMEQSVRDGKVDGRGYYVGDANSDSKTENEAGVKAANKESSKSDVKADSGTKSAKAPSPPAKDEGDGGDRPETLWQKRQRLLSKAISTSVKLGELYADEHVLDPDKSHGHLVWAVETSLGEFRRRREEGSKPGETSWLTPEEFGGSMESLGRDYERKSEFQLAIPLFFQALRLCESPCHRPVIMNNLSAAFAQHPIYSPAAAAQPSETMKELLDSSMPTTRQDSLEAAMNWARNAYTHAQDVKGDARTPECDEACAVALCNWGDVAAMLGKTDLARKKYNQCVDMSRKLDFAPGVKQAQEGLSRLASTPAQRA